MIELKAESVASCDKATLVDISELKINTQKSSAERALDFAGQVKNPYLFKVGDIAVRVEYCGGKTLSETPASALRAG